MSQIYTDHANEAKHDVESPAAVVVASSDKELRRKKRIKCLGYVAAFAVFQTGIILIFVLTIMKIRTPKFRVRSATLVDPPQFGTTSFNFQMDAELGVKNANFGNYKFQNSSVVFYYGGEQVGQAAVAKAKAGWRSTKKLRVSVDLSSGGLPNSSAARLRDEFNSGVLTFNARSKLDGKVELIFIFKKKKSIEMDCTLTIGVADKAVRQISCK